MNRDYRDLLAEFNAQGVEYLVVGAYALAAHGYIRATQALDVWVRPEIENARHVLKALQAVGGASHDLTHVNLMTPGLFLQIEANPVSINVMTAIDGVDFGEAWPARMLSKIADQPVAVLSREHLIKNRRAKGRAQDLADVEGLEAISGKPDQRRG